jgi:hypothetical protein
MCGTDLSGPFPMTECVLAVGGWFSGYVGGDWVIGGGDRRVLWRG